jgi:hypothetical protein
MSDIVFAQVGIGPEPVKVELILPCDTYTIDQSGEVAYTYFKKNQLFFRQGRTVKRINLKSASGEWLETISAENFRSVLGRHFNCVTIIQGDRDVYQKPKLCSADKARGLLASDTVLTLDPIQAVLMCPIFVEDTHGKLKILGKGYHPENGGIYVITDMRAGASETNDGRHSLHDLNVYLQLHPTPLWAPQSRFGESPAGAYTNTPVR